MANILVILRLWFVLLCFVVASFGFQEEEKTALLKLKHAFNGTALSDWGGDEEMDCCKWERVGCSELTKRVTKLYLNDTRPREMSGDFFLDSSLFRPFEELQELRLDENSLKGPIPPELGILSDIHTLNLSHNQLNGSIPRTFSNLKKIESLDLSNNKLSGGIPPDLVQLHFLSFFSVANNNLSGHTPDRKAEFATFGASCYEGNPFLCGLPLPDNCRMSTAASDPNRGENDVLFKDLFLQTFVPSCIVAFLGVAAFIYWHPSCRMLFQFIEAKLST